MMKVTVFFLGLCHLSVNAMLDNAMQYYTQLKILREQGKEVLVQHYMKKYEEHKIRLQNLSCETNGAIAATRDPAHAVKDQNKFLIKEAIELTPYGIDWFGDCIKAADAAYKGPRIK